MNVFFQEVTACALDRWSPGIGDPNGIGWLTVLVYAISGLAALIVAVRGPFPMASRRRERLFWLILAVALFGLAANKQLDLQSFATAVGRCVAKLQGWYQERRAFQLEVILALVAGMILATFLTWRLMRGTLRRNGFALLGMMLVLTFVAVRAIGFHHVDVLINMRVQDMKMNWLLELPGPLMILMNALVLAMRRKPRRRARRDTARQA